MNALREFFLGLARLFYRHKATGIVELGNITILDLIALCQASPVRADLSGIWILDEKYYYPSLADWKRIISDVIVGLPPPNQDRFDCEDYALLVCGRVIEGYQLNAIGIGLSTTHAFNLIYSEAGLQILEPQSGEVRDISELEDKYRVHRVIFF